MLRLNRKISGFGKYRRITVSEITLYVIGRSESGSDERRNRGDGETGDLWTVPERKPLVLNQYTNLVNGINVPYPFIFITNERW